jgi:hypothetical protein
MNAGYAPNKTLIAPREDRRCTPRWESQRWDSLVSPGIEQQTRDLPTSLQNDGRRSCWSRARANLTAKTEWHRGP